MEQTIVQLNSKNPYKIMRRGQSGKIPKMFNLTADVCFSLWDVAQPDDWDVRVNGDTYTIKECVCYELNISWDKQK